jgi:hypothetical protein
LFLNGYSFYITLIKVLLCVRLSRNISTNDAKQEAIRGLEKDLLRRMAQLHEMEQSLPKQNGLYLKIILGNVNVSILNKNDKYVYLWANENWAQK